MRSFFFAIKPYGPQAGSGCGLCRCGLTGIVMIVQKSGTSAGRAESSGILINEKPIILETSYTNPQGSHYGCIFAHIRHFKR
jgi:hypothetical protein